MKSTMIEYIYLKQFNFRTIKDALFHVAFHGAFGNFWSALMRIPQVKPVYSFYASDLHFLDPKQMRQDRHYLPYNVIFFRPDIQSCATMNTTTARLVEF